MSKMKSFLDDWLKKQLASVPLRRPLMGHQPDNPAIQQPGNVSIAPPRCHQQPGRLVPSWCDRTDDDASLVDKGSVIYRSGRPPVPPADE